MAPMYAVVCFKLHLLTAPDTVQQKQTKAAYTNQFLIYVLNVNFCITRFNLRGVCPYLQQKLWKPVTTIPGATLEPSSSLLSPFWNVYYFTGYSLIFLFSRCIIMSLLT